MKNTFQVNNVVKPPFYYIKANLNLTGMKVGETLYFNADNSTDYLHIRDYHQFIQIKTSVIIGDVIVTPNPEVESDYDPIFIIGGTKDLNSPVTIPYIAPAGYGPRSPPDFSGTSLTLEQLNAHPVNYFGHTAAKFPYDRTIITQVINYPTIPMTSNNSNGYVASASSSLSPSNTSPWKWYYGPPVDSEPFQAFDYNDGQSDPIWGTFWSSQSRYEPTTGNYIYDTNTVVDGVPFYGEWLQLQLPVPIILDKFVFKAFDDYYSVTNQPRNFIVAGSVNGTDWTSIYTMYNFPYSYDYTTKMITINVTPRPSQAFQYYRLIVMRVGYLDSYYDETSDIVRLGGWILYSNEYGPMPNPICNYLGVTVSSPSIPDGTPIIKSGAIHVILKVYPK